MLFMDLNRFKVNLLTHTLLETRGETFDELFCYIVSIMFFYNIFS